MRYILTFLLLIFLIGNVSAVNLTDDDVELRVAGSTDTSYSFDIYGGESHTQELEILVFNREVSSEEIAIDTIIEVNGEEYSGSLIETSHPEIIEVGYGSNFFDVTTETSPSLKPVNISIVTEIGLGQEEEEQPPEDETENGGSGGSGGGGGAPPPLEEEPSDQNDTEEDTPDNDGEDNQEDNQSEDEEITLDDVEIIRTDIEKSNIRYPVAESLTEVSTLTVINFISITTIGIIVLLAS